MAMPPGWDSTRARTQYAICGLIALGGRPGNTGPWRADPDGLTGLVTPHTTGVWAGQRIAVRCYLRYGLPCRDIDQN